jgi:hypothetical protein
LFICSLASEMSESEIFSSDMHVTFLSESINLPP